MMDFLKFEETAIKGFVRQRHTYDGMSAKVEVLTGDPERIVTTCFANSSGYFVTDPVPTPKYPGVSNYVVIASADGFDSARQGFQIIGSRAGAGQIFQLAQDLALRKSGAEIPPGREVAGSVEGERDKDLSGAKVIWQQVTLVGHWWRRKYVPTGIVYSARTNIYGHYELALVPPGKYLVTVEAAGYVTYGGGVVDVKPPFSVAPFIYRENYKLTKR